MSRPPLVVHAIHHLSMGGLENGLVNLINRMPPQRYRHAILCMDYFTEFRKRLERDDVEVFAMHRKPGRDPAAQLRVWTLLRRLRPAIVHSRNLSGLDALLPAALAGVGCRIHGEHGWHDGDPDGSSRKYQLLRRIYRPLVSHYVALSQDLEQYLMGRIGVPRQRVTQIINGVDTARFRPAAAAELSAPRATGRFDREHVVIGGVGRFQGIKDPMLLARAFAQLLTDSPELKDIARLAMIGDGVEHARVTTFLNDAGVADYCWLPGARDDVPELMRSIDIFVLPSRGEGISNTVLEAMASGLPVVATDVGGNSELMADGETGTLVPAGDRDALHAAVRTYILDRKRRLAHGAAGRRRVEERFSLEAMTGNYLRLYDETLARCR